MLVAKTERVYVCGSDADLRDPSPRDRGRGGVFPLLYALAALVMMVTAGGGCVDVAVRSAQNAANLKRLSDMLVRLLGLRFRVRHANSAAQRRLKRLYFTDSLNSLLFTTRATLHEMQEFEAFGCFPASAAAQTNLESSSANRVSVRRCSFCYILICGASGRPILTLRSGNNRSEIQTYDPSNQLQWLINFSGRARARGDVIFLLLGGQIGQTGAGSVTNEPPSLALGLSALFVVFLWMFLPYVAVCAVILLGRMVQQQIRRALQSQKCSEQRL